MITRACRIAALLAALGAALAVPAAQQQDPARVEAERREVIRRIERLQQQVQRDEVEKNRQARNLRDADRTVSREQGELTRLRAERAERSAIRRHLQAEKADREAERSRTEADLAKQLRAAYFMGRNEPLKLLLNQRSPAEFSRNLTYYGYLGRLRADQIRELGENIAKIEELESHIAAEDAKLAELEQRQKEQLGKVEAARRQQRQVLANLERESRSRSNQLQTMRQQRQQLERTLERLRRETESLAYDPKAPFARVRNRLSWPVAGRIVTNYGGTITGLGRSEGIDIDTAYGAPVRAVHEGLVIHADWNPGFGQVVILDHGNDYWTVYGHLGELHKSLGDQVAAGQTIGTAGDSGGRKSAGLYFQIRHATKAGQTPQPVDPRPWFRSAAPAAR